MSKAWADFLILKICQFNQNPNRSNLKLFAGARSRVKGGFSEVIHFKTFFEVVFEVCPIGKINIRGIFIPF